MNELKFSVDPVEENWQTIVAKFRKPKLSSSFWQLANTLIPFLLVWFFMYLSLGVGYWLTVLLAPLAAGLQLRLFIIFHDCGHNAFFKSTRANTIVGTVCGFFSLTPYYHWRHFHAIHHATTGNLAERTASQLLPLHIQKYMQNNGDILTLTVNEYRQLSSWERLIYRLYRHPLLFLVLIPSFLFLVVHRFSNPRAKRLERYSVYITNFALFLTVVGLNYFIGLVPLILVELPILVLSSTVGVWLFYVQHQFEDSYWSQQEEWSFVTAALQGSSYYKLPRVLQWFTGNIGFHHIHHLNPRVPNYNLQKCHEASSLFQQTPPLTIRASFKSVFVRLWDEEQCKMISLKQFKRLELEKSRV